MAIQLVENEVNLPEGTLSDFVFASISFRAFPGANENYRMKINENKVIGKTAEDTGATKDRTVLRFPVYFHSIDRYKAIKAIFENETVSDLYISDTSDLIKNMMITSLDRVRDKTIFPIKVDMTFSEYRVPPELLSISAKEGKKTKKQATENVVYNAATLEAMGDLSPIQE